MRGDVPVKYQILITMHVLGASAWIGGHFVLLGVIVPAAWRDGVVARVVEFERLFGRIGLAALAVQVTTGVLLASRWIEWRTVFSAPTAAGHLVLAKMAILGAIVVIGADTSIRILPTLSAATLGRFTIRAAVVTVLSVLVLVCGVGIRTGGLWS